jgi:hypothetical protein
MRCVNAVMLIAVVVAFMGSSALAAADQPAMAGLYRVTFPEPVRVADTLLPSGNYEIRHVMEGSNHIMVFHQLGVKKPVEVRAQCTLVPLPEKAAQSQKIYEMNAAKERVLHELIFKGDSAKHVF